MKKKSPYPTSVEDVNFVGMGLVAAVATEDVEVPSPLDGVAGVPPPGPGAPDPSIPPQRSPPIRSLPRPRVEVHALPPHLSQGCGPDSPKNGGKSGKNGRFRSKDSTFGVFPSNGRERKDF